MLYNTILPPDDEHNSARNMQPEHGTAIYNVWRYQMLYNKIWPDDEHNSARSM